MNDEVSLLKKKIAHMQEEMEYLQYKLAKMRVDFNEKIENDKSNKDFTDNSLLTFDEEFYVSTYPDVKKINMSPYEHYIKYGRKIGRKAIR
ncbi:hypothetical protein M2354_004152 [Leclercia adecarboxylata]|uniref:hypothetical protein n=1 Tax=Leclercia adecarboxylata TaxID=83655 RepID=UPI0024732AF4|nr:hypothetical protein [Leclercia adecarboxylata]MDH6164497.1 hypothetical protein [Leclercia adecarboxylata]